MLPIFFLFLILLNLFFCFLFHLLIIILSFAFKIFLTTNFRHVLCIMIWLLQEVISLYFFFIFLLFLVLFDFLLDTRFPFLFCVFVHVVLVNFVVLWICNLIFFHVFVIVVVVFHFNVVLIRPSIELLLFFGLLAWDIILHDTILQLPFLILLEFVILLVLFLVKLIVLHLKLTQIVLAEK